MEKLSRERRRGKQVRENSQANIRIVQPVAEKAIVHKGSRKKGAREISVSVSCTERNPLYKQPKR